MRNPFIGKTQREQREKLDEATRAVREAQEAAQKTDNLVSTADKNIHKLRTDREKNGYAELFREVIQQPPRKHSFPGSLNFVFARKN